MYVRKLSIRISLKPLSKEQKKCIYMYYIYIDIVKISKALMLIIK